MLANPENIRPSLFLPNQSIKSKTEVFGFVDCQQMPFSGLSYSLIEAEIKARMRLDLSKSCNY